jgi:molybdate transport system substrate-binding protein
MLGATAPYLAAAKLGLSYIHSPAPLAIFERYGFKPYTGAATAN